MKSFLQYFFGAGETVEFVNFTLAHVLPVLVMLGVIFLIYRFRYYQFWLEHTLGYVAVFYMIFVHKMRPTVKTGAIAYGALAGLAVIAYYANSLIGPGANYLFMAKPEDTPSILDILPPNHALRIAIMVAAITALFVLAYLPWYLMDRKARKQASASVQ